MRVSAYQDHKYFEQALYLIRNPGKSDMLYKTRLLQQCNNRRTPGTGLLLQVNIFMRVLR